MAIKQEVSIKRAFKHPVWFVLCIALAGVLVGIRVSKNSEQAAREAARKEVLAQEAHKAQLEQAKKDQLKIDHLKASQSGTAGAQGTDLSQATIGELRSAYEKKLFDVEKSLVDPRFQKATSLPEKISQREALFHHIKGTLEQSTLWLAKAFVQMGGKTQTVVLLLELTPSMNGTESLVPGAIRETNNVCWHLATYFSNRPKETWTGSSSCLESIRKYDELYYIVQALGVGEVDQYFTHLAVPLPLDMNGQAPLELLETQSTSWKRLAPLDWTPISTEEAERIRAEK